MMDDLTNWTLNSMREQQEEISALSLKEFISQHAFYPSKDYASAAIPLAKLMYFLYGKAIVPIDACEAGMSAMCYEIQNYCVSEKESAAIDRHSAAIQAAVDESKNTSIWNV